MQIQRTEISRATGGTDVDTSLPTFRTIEQFSERHPAFTPPALRNLIFKAAPRQSSKGPIPGNGLLESGAIVRLGRRVLINEAKFLAWVQK